MIIPNSPPSSCLPVDFQQRVDAKYAAPVCDIIVDTDETVTISGDTDETVAFCSDTDKIVTIGGDSPGTNDLEGLTLKKLKALCKKTGLVQTGSRAELLERLREHGAQSGVDL